MNWAVNLQAQAASTGPIFSRGSGITIPFPNLINLFGGTPTVADIVSTLIGWLLLLGGVLAFFYVLYGGIRYMTAGPEPKNVDDAKRIIIGGIVGIMIIAVSYAVVTFLVAAINGILT